ncbi:hypothetical protein PIB30_040981 [Stylosanthes scabra]|uniref:Uncharacterized protein n=1 Tax=Stylosanthes scabra TaxID=79078 RepID=A0ABU6VFH3_9FABA|nr:hypothetical protein [Stylosanthes scabra]
MVPQVATLFSISARISNVPEGSGDWSRPGFCLSYSSISSMACIVCVVSRGSSTPRSNDGASKGLLLAIILWTRREVYNLLSWLGMVALPPLGGWPPRSWESTFSVVVVDSAHPNLRISQSALHVRVVDEVWVVEVVAEVEEVVVETEAFGEA